MSIATTESPSIGNAFGADPAGVFDPGLSLLGGGAADHLFGSVEPAGRSGAFRLGRSGDWLFGTATVPLAAGLEAATRQIYGEIFEACRGRHLARVWNYLPAINQLGAAGLENYRIFCRGRSLAFQGHWGAGFKAMLPAASAVGGHAATLTVAFAASSVQTRHVENPQQVPAYDYPGEYGPSAPSFSRATVVPGAQRSTVFISGTAAIRGHVTIAPHDLGQQLECTLENLRVISRACGIGPDLDRGGVSRRHFTVYLRRETDRPMVAEQLERNLLTGRDGVSYFQADLCRAPLLVEIEATLFGVDHRRAEVPL